jgi:hypothetical protein
VGRTERCVSDGGAVLVEAALLVSVVLVAAFGLLDSASAGTAQASLDRSGAAMARSARSAFAGASDLDLLSLLPDTSLVGDLEVRRVIVFRPDTADGSMPAGCDLVPELATPTGVAGSCNVYGPSHLRMLADGGSPARGCGPGSWEGAWCPADRPRQPAGHIGVFIEALHRPPVRLTTPPEGRLLRARAVVLADPPQ